jgi:hypothetical protein
MNAAEIYQVVLHGNSITSPLDVIDSMIQSLPAVGFLISSSQRITKHGTASPGIFGHK